jgi:TonB family protein
MGKVVKYCNACEEGFAEKFGFCPNCGAQLTAFEMSPLDNKPAEEVKTAPVEKFETAAPPVVEAPVKPDVPAIVETQKFAAADVPPPIEEAPKFSAADAPATNEPTETKEAFEFTDDVFEDDTPETAVLPIATTAPAISNESFENNLHQATYAKSADEPYNPPAPHYVPDGGYSPTIVVEKNVKQRNTLLMGAFALGCILMLGSYVYSMFNKFLDIAAIDTPDLLSYVEEVDPTAFELEEQPKKEKEEGGGGGGGGKEDENKASKGREAAQVDNPLFAPSITYTKVTNPDIAIQAATKNKNERQAEKTDDYYGLKNGGDTLSDGDGSGGGQGGGRGRGQGDGEGGGIGNGRGDGRGNGNGDGEGDGDGGGGNIDKLTVNKKPAEPPTPLKIISKPRANYTDAARQNQVQGKVVLRVTFSANGSIGAISVVSGLGYGLTEQAIAAARNIKFEPAKKNGQASSTTKSIEYSFTIY